VALFLGILGRRLTAFKIHDFLPQNTGITPFIIYFLGDILKNSYSLSFKKGKRLLIKRGC
jgi:hypothetical protein